MKFHATPIDGVMLIDIEVTSGSEVEIEAAMMREKFQHVIEETNPGRNFVAATALDDERGTNVGLFGDALNRRSSHFAVASFAPISASVSRSACSNRAVCSVVPRVMRTQPSQP